MIPLNVRNVAPMLAASPPRGQTPEEMIRWLDAEGGWIFTPKWDGNRCLAFIEDGQVTLRSRNLELLTRQFPEVTEALSAMLPRGDFILDGELICLVNGKPSMATVSSRARRTRLRHTTSVTQPATYVAFDLLYLNTDLREHPLSSRLEVLQHHGEDWPPVLQVCPAHHDATDLWHRIQKLDLEGMVAKRLDSRYVSRRNPDWIKLKLRNRATCFVTGLDQGEGDRATTFGALHLSLWKSSGSPYTADELVRVGKVGSGFTNRDIAEVCNHLRSGRPLVIDVEYLNISPSGQLREPVFKGVRSDCGPDDCTLDQLERP